MPGPTRQRRRRLCVLPAALLLTLAVLPACWTTGAMAAGQPDAPLPDAASLIREVRAGLRTDEDLLRQYTFKERRQDVKVTKLGKVYFGPWREFEVYPSQVPGETYKRLVASDGRPLPAAELARRDEAHRKTVLDRLEQIRVETPVQRQKRLSKQAKDRREQEAMIDDVFAVYEIAVIGRERIDGRSMILTSLTPRKRAQTKSDAGKYLKRMQGRAWIDEVDRQVVRLEMDVIDDITFGLGLLARMHKGSAIVFRRERVNGEIWLPAEAQYKMAGKTLIFRRFDLSSTTRYSDYRKFNVTTSETISDVK